MFLFLNRDTVSRAVTVHMIPQSGSFSTTNLMIGEGDKTVIRPGETKRYIFPQVLNSLDFVQWKVDVANKVTGRFSAVEVTP